jgi:PBP1b-binding outer membrane lipoprotein LpoB
MKIKKIFSIILAAIFLVGAARAAEKGPTSVVKKDEHRIAGVGTNGITRWTSGVARDDEEVSAVNQSGNTAMVSVTNKKTGKTRILNYDAEKGILRFSQGVN